MNFWERVLTGVMFVVILGGSLMYSFIQTLKGAM
jgi:hypothetical protein